MAVLENLSPNLEAAARQAESVGEKILKGLSLPYSLDGTRHHSTSSIGITMFDKTRDSVDELMKRADMAMYQAKAAGRNTLRFFDPEMLAVSPAMFIPLAEETGLILPMGTWILQTACMQLKQWSSSPKTRYLRMAVKVSAHQFRQRDFVDQVVGILDETGANAGLLALELNESLLVH